MYTQIRTHIQCTGTCVYGNEDRKPFGTFINANKYEYQTFKTGRSEVLYPKEEGFLLIFPPILFAQ